MPFKAMSLTEVWRCRCATGVCWHGIGMCRNDVCGALGSHVCTSVLFPPDTLPVRKLKSQRPPCTDEDTEARRGQLTFPGAGRCPSLLRSTRKSLQSQRCLGKALSTEAGEAPRPGTSFLLSRLVRRLRGRASKPDTSKP